MLSNGRDGQKYLRPEQVAALIKAGEGGPIARRAHDLAGLSSRIALTELVELGRTRSTSSGRSRRGVPILSIAGLLSEDDCEIVWKR
jgi:hypothetical protein